MAAFVVALTGGVASGKSEVERRFVALGAKVIDADHVARDLVEPGLPALGEIVAAFGVDALTMDGRLDRSAMRHRVFADPIERKQLETILHPRIRDEMRRRAEQSEAAYAILAIPLLAENASAYEWVDRIVVVDVPRAVQIDRLLRRDGVDRALANAMVDAQANREQRLAIADDVIDNSGPLAALDEIVATLHDRYRALAGTGRAVH